jgi:superfamily I DNA and/or RNA helicase
MLASSETRFILVGDPCQLGPHVRSHEAARLGLGVPLMERLRAAAALRRRSLVVQLVNNYRAHWRSGHWAAPAARSVGRSGARLGCAFA